MRIMLNTSADRTIFSSNRPETVRAYAGLCYVECGDGDGHPCTGRLVLDLDVFPGDVFPAELAISVTPDLARHLARCLLQAAEDVEQVAKWEAGYRPEKEALAGAHARERGLGSEHLGI